MNEGLRCRHFPVCGGCTLLDIPYRRQLESKQSAFLEVVEVLGAQTVPIRPSPVIEGWRHKVQLPFGRMPRRFRPPAPVVGCYRRDSHEVVDLLECRVQHPDLTLLVQEIRAWADDHQIPVYDEIKGTGWLRHLLLRRGASTGEVLLGLVTCAGTPEARNRLVGDLKDRCQTALRRAGDSSRLVGVVRNLQTRATNVVLGQREELWWGRPWLRERLGRVEWRVPLGAFLQVNPHQVGPLYDAAREGIPEGAVVVEGYAGMGTISAWIADRAKNVIAVEEHPGAVAMGRAALRAAGVRNVRLIRGDAARLLPDLVAKGADTLVVDPPRKGLDEPVLESLTAHPLRRLVYVSCNPLTLVRDLLTLAPAGWRVNSLQPFDMFPHTDHVECVAVCSR